MKNLRNISTSADCTSLWLVALWTNARVRSELFNAISTLINSVVYWLEKQVHNTDSLGHCPKGNPQILWKISVSKQGSLTSSLKKKPCYLVYINTKGLNLKTSYEFHNKYHEFSCCIHYAPYTYRLSLDLSK